MNAREIMTGDPACCTPTDTARHAATLMADRDCGCVPVVADLESHRLVGVVTDRDLATRGLARGLGPETPVRDLMTDNPNCCGPDDDLAAVERIMTERQVRRVPVVDGDGCCVGIVAQADLARERGAVDESELGRVVEAISEPRGSSTS